MAIVDFAGIFSGGGSGGGGGQGSVQTFNIPVSFSTQTVDSSITYEDILATYNAGNSFIITDTDGNASYVASTSYTEDGYVGIYGYYFFPPGALYTGAKLIAIEAFADDGVYFYYYDLNVSGHIPVLNSFTYSAMAPNVFYRFVNTVTGLVTFSFEAPTDSTILNEYMFSFKTGDTPPVITWPNQIKVWEGNNYPAINANKEYEVRVVDGRGVVGEFPLVSS